MDRIGAIGLMSGSSLDGLDISYGYYSYDKSQWNFEFIVGKSIPFPSEFYKQLKISRSLDTEKIFLLDKNLGDWMGQQVALFNKENKIEPHIIGSHGHTIFHKPAYGYSIQIGNGQAIASQSGVKTVNNFRTKDIINGGQGAPLVPIGDLFLFDEFDSWLNLGGIANISLLQKKTIIGWDIAPCNQVLNYLANRIGQKYDKKGALAQNGDLIKTWHLALESLEYFEKPPPKSISNEWVNDEILQKIPQDNIADLSYTFCVFVGKKMADVVNQYQPKKLMVTGGGTFHNFLIAQIKNHLESTELIIPSKEIINLKEAIIFGFMAVLKQMNQINILKSVTGAMEDSCAGTIYNP